MSVTKKDINTLTKEEFLEAYIQVRDEYQRENKQYFAFSEILELLVKTRVISPQKYKEFLSVIPKIYE